MKVGLKRGSKWYHAITRMVSRSGYSHAAVEIGGRLYESTALKGDHARAGVRDYPLTAEIAAQYEWLDLGADFDSQALANYELIRGKGYDYFSLLSFLNVEARDSRRFYCYEAVLWMLGGRTKGRVTVETILYFIFKFRK